MESLHKPIVETEEHSFCTEMMKRLNILRRNELFCDVLLEVGSGNNQARLKAHRNVLCAVSPFFYNALNSDMKEKKEGVIRFEEISKASMEELLDYFYTGRVEITKENAFELFARADYFLIPSLKALSSKFILQSLDLNNWIVAYCFAIKYHWKGLLKGVTDFILANFRAVAGTRHFLNLSSKHIENWISSNKIVVKEEEEVFQVIVKWMEENRNRQEVDFLQLLRHVRCIYLSRSFVFNIILQHPLVSGSTACTKFVLDAMKEVANGTDECFFSQPPRDCLKTHEDAIVACGKRKTLCYLPSENKWYHLASRLYIRDSCFYSLRSLHNKLFIVGGCTDARSSVVECFEPTHNQWVPAKAPGIVKNGTAAASLQGFLYIVGGFDESNNPITSVQKYNPDTNQWQDISPLSSPRSNVCAVADGNYLYAIGGCSAGLEYLDIVERFDPQKNMWVKLSSLHVKRSSASGTAAKQKVFVFGGLSDLSRGEDPCEMYDPNTNIWSTIASEVAPKYSATASAISFKGNIYVFGSFKTEQNKRHRSLHVYNIEKNQWKNCLSFRIKDETEYYQISALRIPIDILANFKES